MKRLLLTGASGFLGWNICQEGSKLWQITGVANSNDVAIPDVEIVKADLTDFNALVEIFQSSIPDAVIHIAANSDPNYCEMHPAETHAINVGVAINLAALCAKENIPFVFTSSDLVFDGNNGNYLETDVVHPVNQYGAQKIKAEEEILKVYPNATICRMPLMFGDGGPVAKSFLQPFLQKMRAGEALSLFHDEYRSVVGGQSAAKGLLLAVETFQGIYHLGGKERLSRYEFGLMVQDLFDLPQAIIIPCSQKDVILSAPRPADVSMDSSKAYAMGYEPMRAREELRELVTTQ